MGRYYDPTDISQNVVNCYAYDFNGAVTNQVEAVPQPFKFVGRFGVMAEPNGFYYIRARYFDPTVGRCGLQGNTNGASGAGFSGGLFLHAAEPWVIRGSRNRGTREGVACRSAVDTSHGDPAGRRL